MAWRATKKMRRNPEQWFDVTLQPLLFTAMFAYIFGGAISGSVADYLPILIPGILAQTALTASHGHRHPAARGHGQGRLRPVQVAADRADRARSSGPAIADLLRYGTAATLTILTGFLMGYRPGGGVAGVLGGWLMTVFAGWSLAWIFTWFGTVARSAQAVQGISMMIMFPLTFLSNAFVPADTLPSWLQTFVRLNPVSHVVTAVRTMMAGGGVTTEVAWALGGCAAIVAVFLPLAVRSYSRKM